MIQFFDVVVFCLFTELNWSTERTKVQSGGWELGQQGQRRRVLTTSVAVNCYINSWIMVEAQHNPRLKSVVQVCRDRSTLTVSYMESTKLRSSRWLPVWAALKLTNRLYIPPAPQCFDFCCARQQVWMQQCLWGLKSMYYCNLKPKCRSLFLSTCFAPEEGLGLTLCPPPA